MLNKPTAVGEDQFIEKLLDNMALREGIEKALNGERFLTIQKVT